METSTSKKTLPMNKGLQCRGCKKSMIAASDLCKQVHTSFSSVKPPRRTYRLHLLRPGTLILKDGFYCCKECQQQIARETRFLCCGKHEEAIGVIVAKNVRIMEDEPRVFHARLPIGISTTESTDLIASTQSRASSVRNNPNPVSAI